MIIYTLWRRENDADADVPWLEEAVDEYTVDNNCEFPPEYAKKRALPEYRELIIDVPEKDVRALFESPTVKGKVVKEET